MLLAATVENRLTGLSGKQFGLLRFDRASTKRGDNNRIYAIFSCQCGGEIELPVSRVTSGIRQHCGCQANRTPNLQHGMRYSGEYSSWQAMKGRCLDPDNKDFPRWGGKGITIFPPWIESFEAFFAHIGPRPPRTTVDRIDNLKGYFPGNVRWASSSEQASNRRDVWVVEIDGVEFPSVDAAAAAHSVSNTTIVRWCDGYTDARRVHQQRHTHPPKPGCKRWRKYGD